LHKKIIIVFYLTTLLTTFCPYQELLLIAFRQKSKSIILYKAQNEAIDLIRYIGTFYS